MNQISDRLRGLVQSDIRRMSRECDRVNGINLGQGICDLPTIPELVEGACDAIVANKATYSKFEGIDLLRERIARKLAHYNGLTVDPAKEIVVTVGSSGGFLTAAMATLNAGDEVILFEPYYGYHLNTLSVLGFIPKFVPLQAPDWSIDFDALRAAFTLKTRAIVVCTPSNPSGKMFTREELEKIGALCREFNAWVFTDEIYEYIVYDGREHVSMASIPSCRDITITISGFSKTFSITGWRIGYAVADPQVAGPIGLMNDLFAICAPTPLQWGVARALEVPDSYYRSATIAKPRNRSSKMPGWLPFRDPHFSFRMPARGCCVSATRRISSHSKKPASGFGRSLLFEFQVPIDELEVELERRDFPGAVLTAQLDVVAADEQARSRRRRLRASPAPSPFRKESGRPRPQ